MDTIPEFPKLATKDSSEESTSQSSSERTDDEEIDHKQDFALDFKLDTLVIESEEETQMIGTKRSADECATEAGTSVLDYLTLYTTKRCKYTEEEITTTALKSFDLRGTLPGPIQSL